jgi:hypothetical protein
VSRRRLQAIGDRQDLPELLARCRAVDRLAAPTAPRSRLKDAPVCAVQLKSRPVRQELTVAYWLSPCTALPVSHGRASR